MNICCNFLKIFFISYEKEGLEVSAKLLEANPEHYTAWNYRKLAVDHRLNQSEPENSAESIKAILDEELRLVCLLHSS